MKKPLILVTNDDGIFAGGIRQLIAIARELGEVVVVAPDSAQSATGHAITVRTPLRIRTAREFPDLKAYKCDGTPVDCVKLAKHILLKDRKIDLCISGINHGSNASINIIYSGTVSAAMEASLDGIPSIGFSLLNFSHDADFRPCKNYVKAIIAHVLENGMGDTNLLNVNIPNLPESEIKGVKVCRQADARWVEKFVEKKDPMGQPYYWLSGEFVNFDKGSNTDQDALESGYISVVPSHHDLTRHQAINGLTEMDNIYINENV